MTFLPSSSSVGSSPYDARGLPLIIRYSGYPGAWVLVDLRDIQGCLQSALGPELDSRLKRLQPVYEHDKLSKGDP